MQQIVTSRLRLVPPSTDHAADVFAYGSRPEFARFLTGKPQRSAADAEAFLRSLIADNEAGRRMYWCAQYLGRIVGTLGFIFAPNEPVEFGYGFSPDVWGTGIAHEAAAAVLDFGRRSLGFDRVTFFTMKGNQAAIRGVEKLGFVRDGIIPYGDGEGVRLVKIMRESALPPSPVGYKVA